MFVFVSFCIFRPTWMPRLCISVDSLFQWSTCVHTCNTPPQLSDGGGRDQVSTEFQVFPRYTVSSLRSASYSCSTFHLKAGRQGTILARSTFPVLPAAPLALLLFPCSTWWLWPTLMSKQGTRWSIWVNCTSTVQSLSIGSVPHGDHYFRPSSIGCTYPGDSLVCSPFAWI